MAQLPIRQLTLWKQGIGYFERRGGIEEPTVTLVVPRNAANDVLATLHVDLTDGSHVVSVDYETPEDKSKQLEDLSVKLADRSSMVDLVVSLRGSLVTLVLDGDQSATGRIIGVEASLDGSVQPPTVIIQSSAEGTNQISVFP